MKRIKRSEQPFERSGERGAAMVITLIMVSMIVVLVADATSIARIELEASRNADVELKLEYACRGGYHFAEAHLRQDFADSPDLDSLLEEWSRPLEKSFDASEVTGEGSSFYEDQQPAEVGGTEADSRIPQVRIWIEDEERKWPLALLKVSNEPTQKRRVEGLKHVIDSFREGTRFDIDPGTAQSYAEAIYQYVKRPERDEGNFGVTPRPGSRSGMILKPTDLALIPSIPDHVIYDYYDDEGGREDGTIVRGLMHFLTPWTDLQINVNTAPHAVLRGMFRDDPREASVARDIIDKRDEDSGELGQELERRREMERARDRNDLVTGSEEDEPAGAVFTTVDDIQEQIPTMTQRLFNETRQLMTVTSKVYSIWVEARMQGIRKTRRYVVRRDGPRFVLILTEEVHYPVLRRVEDEEAQDDFR